MGKKNKQKLSKLTGFNKKMVKKMGRNQDKIRRAKIQKLKSSAQKIGSKELRVPQLQNFKNKLQAQIQRRKNGQKKLNILNKNQQQKNQLAYMQQNNNGMEMDDEVDYKNNNDQANHNLKNVKNVGVSIDHILENADILLEVLDVRDPEGCRCKILERRFISHNPSNKIILVLNKIDLVPQNVALQWKRILSKEFPTVLFKANLQNQNSNLGSNTMFSKSLTQRNELAQQLINSSKALGVSQLLQLIKNYSKVNGIKQNVTVGIVGYPNVGKSSLINSMTLKKSASVSNKPGHTKNIQRIELDSQVTLLDCPGVFFTNETETQLLLKNAIKPEDVQDVEKAIQQIVNRCEKEQLMNLYQIQDFMNYKQLLILLAQRWGKFKKKGILDLQQTARILIQDWNNGKLKYFVAPPLELAHFENTIVTNNLIQ